MPEKYIMNKWFTFKSNEVIRFLIIFYIVGLAGFLMPFTRNIFLALAKWALLLNIVLILWFHKRKYDSKTIIIFSLIFILGYIIETVGVNTGLIFGNYRYGDALGPKIFKTPLLIGINWLMLSYCFASAAARLKMPAPIKIIACSAGMLIYDIIMEQSASLLGMWYWKNGSIPLQNYAAWLIAAAVFQTLLTGSGLKLKNPVAVTILICQFAFFILLAVFKNIIP